MKGQKARKKMCGTAETGIIEFRGRGGRNIQGY